MNRTTSSCYVKALIVLGACAFAAATFASIPLHTQGLSAQSLATRDVIVVLRDQITSAPPQRRAMQARSAALASAQDAVFARLPVNGKRKKTRFQMVNAFATSVTLDEADQLARDPNVLAVVPDQIIRLTKPPKADAAKAAVANDVALSSNPASLCNTLEPQALQLVQAAFLDPAVPQAQRVRDGNGQLVTGRGVKVAYIADGLDPNVAGFIHTDGTPVFIDYQDFSGNPPGTPTDGREAFLDASSVAAQDTPGGTPLTFDISTYSLATPALPSPCNIQIRGIAPGVSMVGLNVDSAEFSTMSAFVKAIEYAVVVDDVDVINESFAHVQDPDENADPISLANKAAILAGVTVVACTGDAGPGGTIHSPAADEDVIAVGATTQLRSYAQTGRSAIALASGGYVDNDMSAFSSAGFTQRTGRTVDVVAPGDDGWALCSTDTSRFTGCVNPFSQSATPFYLIGGTSESAPLVAGEAALIIQAYRSTHGGRSPSPALIKRIVMSTATDLGAPPEEQGAGLINALSAVYAALAANGGQGPAAHSAGAKNNVLVTALPGSFILTDKPGVPKSLNIALTNLGTQPQSLNPRIQALRKKVASDHQVIAIDTTTQAFTLQPIAVPGNVDHLDVSLSYPTTIGSPGNPIVRLALIDASNRLVVDSRPQGRDNGFQHVEAIRPAAGTWTAVVYTTPTGLDGSYSGPIQFSWRADQMTSVGTVSPSHLVLAPGATTVLTAALSMPVSPGDAGAVIRLNPPGTGSNASIPVSLRSLVPVSSTGAAFTGTLTGGNSRYAFAPMHFYSFDVPPGIRDMNLILDVPGDGYLLQGILVGPNGQPYSFDSTEDPLTGAPTRSMQLSRYDPTPGRWQFSLTEFLTTSGEQTEIPFSGNLGFNAAQVTAAGLPNSDRVALSASAAPLAVPISLINNSHTTRMYFVDARRPTSVVTDLPIFGTCNDPATLPGACIGVYVPTQSRAVAFRSQSTAPVMTRAFDYAGTLTSGISTHTDEILGWPDGAGGSTALLFASEIPYSTWLAYAELTGRSRPGGLGTYPVTMTATALSREFDAAMISDSGDFWADTVNLTATFDPLILAPGQSGQIYVYIQPDPAKIGKVVSGDLFIDTFNYVQFNGDEMVRIPYRYRVVQ